MLRKFLVGLVALFSFGVAAKALSTVEIVAQAKPCVVTIQVWNSANPKKPVSSGTGFFIADDKIVTDAHVVNGDYDRIMVTSLSGEQIYVEGKALYDNGAAEVDLAILKVQNAGTHAHLEFAASLPQEGENVTVIGNPQGLTGTVSTGIVSAVRKNGEIIQFTAPVSNGSSGGPVLDDDGKVIGIADFILTPRGNEIAQNLNFAHGVPVMQLALNNSSSATVYYNSAQEQQAEQNIPGHQTLKPLDEPNADERNLRCRSNLARRGIRATTI